MAFLIRTIDTTAAGREIVRDRVLEEARITVGRAELALGAAVEIDAIAYKRKK